MKKIDWDKAFGERPESFHESVNSALTEISNREENIMKNVSLKKKVIITAAAVMALGATAIAAGKVTSYSSHSYVYDKVYTTAELQKLADDADFGVTYPEGFSTGFEFKSGTPATGSANDAEDNAVKEYKSFDAEYEKDGTNVILDVAPIAEYEEMPEEEPAKEVDGIKIYTEEMTMKFVPADYVKTEQDIADEEAGKISISFGTDEVEIMTMRSAKWAQDGNVFNILDMSGTVDMEDLTTMAEEVIEAQK